MEHLHWPYGNIKDYEEIPCTIICPQMIQLLYVCLSKIRRQTTNFQCDGIWRWRWLGHETLINGISVLKKVTQRTLFSLETCGDTTRRELSLSWVGLHQTPNPPAQIGLLASQNCEKWISIIHKPPGFWYSVLADQID